MVCVKKSRFYPLGNSPCRLTEFCLNFFSYPALAYIGCWTFFRRTHAYAFKMGSARYVCSALITIQ
jgi:hypothetical protein